jgi:UDP-N-acetylglucosamine--N-acetylmuramyl-(pentapeptide) pyrophosphoryl-undecaprenol N-acetylglucosamine transferase
MSSPSSSRLLIAASGTGGHVFPAIATAEQLADYAIEWLGVPDRLENQLVGDLYPLHRVDVAGFQGKPGIGTVKTALKLLRAVFTVRQLLQRGQFDGVFTTGGYIAAPAIMAARSLGLPAILHESNALPGKVTRWFAPWCDVVAVGYEAAQTYLPKAKVKYVGTPVRSQFLAAVNQATSDLPGLAVPSDVPLIVVVGGSQGAVAVNQLVRQAAPVWLAAGAWVVHQTGATDPDAQTLQHPHYLTVPFYDHMAALLQRADLAISRAGAGTLTELTVTQTPAILIPYPFAAEDHQAYNATVLTQAGAAIMARQGELTAETLAQMVAELLADRDRLHHMASQAGSLAVIDSAAQVAQLIRQRVPRKR